MTRKKYNYKGTFSTTKFQQSFFFGRQMLVYFSLYYILTFCFVFNSHTSDASVFLLLLAHLVHLQIHLHFRK